jgi:hypothetical protein
MAPRGSHYILCRVSLVRFVPPKDTRSCVDAAQLTTLWFIDDKYKKVYNKNKSPISHAIFQYLNIESATELETRTLRRIICRLLQEKRHRTIVTSPFKKGDIRYKPLWVEIVQYNGFEPSTTAHRIRYLELLELLIENVPNLLETPLGKARNVADRLVLFDDVADKRNEIRQMIEPTLKKQESLCITM